MPTGFLFNGKLYIAIEPSKWSKTTKAKSAQRLNNSKIVYDFIWKFGVRLRYFLPLPQCVGIIQLSNFNH